MPSLSKRPPFSIELRKIEKRFGALSVLEDINASIPPGAFVSLVGPSGCGKSTLLRIIAGLENASSGGVLYDGKPGLERFSVSFVFQEAQLLPWRTVWDNAKLPLEFSKEESTADKIASTLSRVGLHESKDFYPNQLSGGMKMRASLARALVTTPRLLLLDEPFSALDEVTRFKLQEELLSLWREGGFTVVFVTHSISEAAYLSQTVYLISKTSHRMEERKLNLPAVRNRLDPQYLGEVKHLQEKFQTLGGLA